jgi:hypothetical protein
MGLLTKLFKTAARPTTQMNCIKNISINPIIYIYWKLLNDSFMNIPGTPVKKRQCLATCSSVDGPAATPTHAHVYYIDAMGSLRTYMHAQYVQNSIRVHTGS